MHVATGYFLKEINDNIVLTLKAYDEGTLFAFIPGQAHEREEILYGFDLSIQTKKKMFLSLNFKTLDLTDKKKKKSLKYKLSLVNNIKDFTGVAFIFEDI